jgi:hypothetical protein
MSRWVRVQTSIFDHELFAAEPFSEREAWLWMITNAAWKDTIHRIGAEVVKVPTGSFFATIRDMQKRWGWKSTTRVSAFLKVLEAQGMIKHTAKTGKTHVSICNYYKYQNVEDRQKTPKTQPEDTGKTQKTPVTPISTSLRSVDTCAQPFEKFWEAYPNKTGRPSAEKAFSQAIKRASLDEIMAGVRTYAAKTDDRQWCSPVRWLSDDRWKDQPAKPPDKAPPKPSGLAHLQKSQTREEYIAQELARSQRSFR